MMKYMNVVKFKVKQKYLVEFETKAYQQKNFKGQLNEYFVKTGEHDYIAVGLWESEEKMIAARPAMIDFLDSIRHTLEELSPTLGVTDPAAGHVMFEG